MGDKLKYYTVDSWHSILLHVVPAVFFEDCFKAWCREKKYPGLDSLSAEGAVYCFSSDTMQENCQGELLTSSLYASWQLTREEF